MITGNLATFSPGVFRYRPDTHDLVRTAEGDARHQLFQAVYGDQTWVDRATVMFLITGVVARTAGKYKDRAERYVLIEGGCAGQNMLLAATGLGLKAGIVGAFHDDVLRQLLGLDAGELPVLLITAGK